jgi:rubrerythrin
MQKNNSEQMLESIYHRGQEKIWDGRAVLAELLEKHGGIVTAPPRQQQALQNIFAMILAGENAAWKISLQLADLVESTEARLAATSQAHDESRHFYVMRDYLNLTDYTPTPIPEPVQAALEMVLKTRNLSKKLLGMQLMVEPVALTIFQEIRRVSPEPVLTELLEYFERDEARHVALGVHYLPAVVKDMSTVKIASLIVWQMKIFMLELKGLRELRDDFEALGLNVEDVFNLAEKKQLDALREFVKELGLSPKVWEPLRYFIRYQKGRVL